MAYMGTPFRDEKHSGNPQQIPGRVFCAYYDAGGDGIAYHTHDNLNNGSGILNPENGSYLHSFRIGEGVSTSYVKYYDEIDNNQYNQVIPEKDMLYVGWTQPGDWINLTVEVAESGVYSVSLLYTSRYGGRISLSVDGNDTTGPLEIVTTFNENDPVDWRQWHHWNCTVLTDIELSAGTHVLTIHTLENGNMNYGYLEFSLKQ